MKTKGIRMLAQLAFPIAVLTAVFASSAGDDNSRANPVAPARYGAPAVGSRSDSTIARNQAAEADEDHLQATLLASFEKHESVTNTLGMVMVWLPVGYRAAQYEVTQSQYQKIMGENPSAFTHPEYAVNNVTLSEARQFCMNLTMQESAAKKLPKGYYYSLPSEEQWEYYVDKADLEKSVTAYYGDRYHPENVGIFPPNDFGLYDTRGGVWDLCDNGVARGGSWYSYDDYVYVWFRFVTSPNQRYNDLGFRILVQSDGASDRQSLSTSNNQPIKR